MPVNPLRGFRNSFKLPSEDYLTELIDEYNFDVTTDQMAADLMKRLRAIDHWQYHWQEWDMRMYTGLTRFLPELNPEYLCGRSQLKRVGSSFGGFEEFDECDYIIALAQDPVARGYRVILIQPHSNFVIKVDISESYLPEVLCDLKSERKPYFKDIANPELVPAFFNFLMHQANSLSDFFDILCGFRHGAPVIKLKYPTPVKCELTANKAVKRQNSDEAIQDSRKKAKT